MATVRKKAEHRYEARVQRKGHPAISKSFNNRRDAETWALQTEAEITRGSYIPRREAERTTVEEIAVRFEHEFAPHHYRGPAWRHKLAHIRAKLGKYALSAVTPKLVGKYRDERLHEPDSRCTLDPANAPRMSPATVKMELDLLSKLLDVAEKEFGIILPNGNPVRSIRKPAGATTRERRLVGDEESRILAECERGSNPWLSVAVRLALSTAMRQGELLALRWENIDFERRVVLLDMTKNGESRSVPLSSAAVAALQSLPRNINGKVFAVSRMTLYKAFIGACKRAEAHDLTFHDLRHEAISRLAERGDFTVLDLAAVSGHKTLQMLKRYTHLQAETLARKVG